MNSLERDVRRLLRRARDGPEIGTALAERLRLAYRTQSASAALDIATTEALRGCSPARRATLANVLRSANRARSSERSYYRAKKELVERLAAVICGRLNAPKPRSKTQPRETMPIALQMVDHLVPEAISPEQYRGPDRGRAFSAAALAAEMSGEQGRADVLISEAAMNVRNQYDRRDAASAFEVLQNEFFIARCRGSLRAMRAAVRNMARLHDRLGPPAHAKFALDCSEVFLYEGRLHDAGSELDFALLNASSCDGTLLRSIALVRKAQIAFARHDLRTAEEAGQAAMQTARPHADIRVYAAEVLGRSSLRTGSRWSSNGLEECRSVYHALSVQTVLARHRLRHAKMGTAYEMAEKSYEQAMRHQYWDLASRSASTIAACLTSGESQAWFSQALRLYMHSKYQNAYVGDDLFELGLRTTQVARSFLLSQDAVELMDELYRKRFPNPLFEKDRASLLSSAIPLMLRCAFDERAGVPADIFAPSPKQRALRSVGLQELEREIGRLGQFIGTLAILFPTEERPAFITANRKRTHEMTRALRRSLARHHWEAYSS